MTVRGPALGGVHAVPEPDPIARDYLLLALRLDQRISGLVDGYFGPADLKAQVDMEQLRPPAALLEDADELAVRIPLEVEQADRGRWLTAQVRALRTHAAALTGDVLPYVEHVERCFDLRPVWHDDAEFEAARRELDRLLPGSGPVIDRLEDWDRRLVIDPDRLPSVVEWLVERYRSVVEPLFGLPDGEDLKVALVRGRPWSGYNWYHGGFRSRVELNVDLPIRASELVRTVAHETYPGHHLEHAWKEADLVEARHRLEASVLLINAPECLISEGLAEVGARFVAAGERGVDLLAELFERARLPFADESGELHETAARTVAIAAARHRLSAARSNAGLMLHAEGASRQRVRSYLEQVGLVSADRVEKRLEFIEHPLWRTYVFVYSQGEALVERWLASSANADDVAGFRRVLHEQLTPGAIVDEIAAG